MIEYRVVCAARGKPRHAACARPAIDEDNAHLLAAFPFDAYWDVSRACLPRRVESRTVSDWTPVDELELA